MNGNEIKEIFKSKVKTLNEVGKILSKRAVRKIIIVV